MEANITTVGGRRKLAVRNEPFWRKEAGAYLGFRCIGPNGEGTWVGRIYEGGKQHYCALGAFDEYRLAAAALREWLQRRAEGVAPGNEKATVADVCTAYIADLRRNRGDGPANDALGRLERRVIGRDKASRKRPLKAHSIARVKCSDLRAHHLSDWRLSLAPEGDVKLTRAQRASAQRDLTTFRAALNYGRKKVYSDSDAAWAMLEGFKDTAAGADSKPYVTLEDRRKLLAQCGPGLADLVEGLIVLGARPVELARATVGDFDARAKTLRLWSMKGRSAERRERHVPLDALPGALDLIRRLAKAKLPLAPLFARADGKAWAHSDHDEPFKEAVHAAGLDDNVVSYCMRHSFITDAVSAGVPIDMVARVTGTGITMIEKTYGKLVSEHAKLAFAKVAAL